MNPENVGGTLRGSRPIPPPADSLVDEEAIDEEQRVAITVGVADGFKFGCGMILAGIAFYFALIIMVAAALLVALIFNLPLPLGVAGR